MFTTEIAFEIIFAFVQETILEYNGICLQFNKSYMIIFNYVNPWKFGFYIIYLAKVRILLSHFDDTCIGLTLNGQTES